MREIIFRGLRKDGGGWVEGDLRQYNYGGRAINSWNAPLAEFDIDPETVGQYTGLVDRNGKRIFEGDIIEWEPSVTLCGAVGFDEGGFCANHYFLQAGLQAGEFRGEVIANRWDNPELMEGEKGKVESVSGEKRRERMEQEGD